MEDQKQELVEIIEGITDAGAIAYLRRMTARLLPIILAVDRTRNNGGNE